MRYLTPSGAHHLFIDLWVCFSHNSQIFYTDTKAACNPDDATQTVCAVTNDYENITSPWYYDGKFAQGYTIPARNFFEGESPPRCSPPPVVLTSLYLLFLLLSRALGGILLNGLVDLAGLAYLPCYSSFLATTRVSNQVNSVSMDFAYGALHKCGLTIDADCLGGRQLVLDLNTTKYTIPPFEWNYTVSVTNQYVLAPCPGVSCSCWHSPQSISPSRNDRGYNDLFDVVVELNGDVIYDVGTLKSQEIFFENGTVPTNASEIDMVFKASATGNLGRTVVVDSYNPCTSPVPVSDNGLTPGTVLHAPCCLSSSSEFSVTHLCQFFLAFLGEKAAIAIGGFVAAAVVVAAVAGLVAAGYAPLAWQDPIVSLFADMLLCVCVCVCA